MISGISYDLLQNKKVEEEWEGITFEFFIFGELKFFVNENEKHKG